MRCPYCGSLDTQVKDSPADRRLVLDPPPPRLPRLRRALHHFRARAVARTDSGQEIRPAAPFDRDKLVRSVQIALRKRPVDPERVDRMINGLVRQLENQGEAEIPSETIGELVMQGLKTLDEVAYVRFASVYRNFREARDFGPLLDEFAEEGAARRKGEDA